MRCTRIIPLGRRAGWARPGSRASFVELLPSLPEELFYLTSRVVLLLELLPSLPEELFYLTSRVLLLLELLPSLPEELFYLTSRVLLLLKRLRKRVEYVFIALPLSGRACDCAWLLDLWLASNMLQCFDHASTASYWDSNYAYHFEFWIRWLHFLFLSIVLRSHLQGVALALSVFLVRDCK
jgi:hypothetical protein